MGIGQVDLRY